MDTKTEVEKAIDELEWFRAELVKGEKSLVWYQAQVDILTRAIKLLKQPYEIGYSDDEVCKSFMDDLRSLTDEKWKMLDSMKEVRA